MSRLWTRRWSEADAESVARSAEPDTEPGRGVVSVEGCVVGLPVPDQVESVPRVYIEAVDEGAETGEVWPRVVRITA
jgi:hypothetical protein